jgi:hypothetical protein
VASSDFVLFQPDSGPPQQIFNGNISQLPDQTRLSHHFAKAGYRQKANARPSAILKDFDHLRTTGRGNRDQCHFYVAPLYNRRKI